MLAAINAQIKVCRSLIAVNIFDFQFCRHHNDGHDSGCKRLLRGNILTTNLRPRRSLMLGLRYCEARYGLLPLIQAGQDVESAASTCRLMELAFLPPRE